MARAEDTLSPDRKASKDDGEGITGSLVKVTLHDATANFAIKCEGRCFMAHRQILEKASPYFEAMFRFKGLEVTQKEVKLNNVDMYSMNHILNFIYNNHYTLRGGTPVPPAGYSNHTATFLRKGPQKCRAMLRRNCICGGKVICPTHLISHIRIYGIADYLGIANLKTLARQGVLDVLHVYWDSEKLNLANALEEAFSNTPENDCGIRDLMMDLLKDHPGVWVDEGSVQDWLLENPEVLKKVDSDWGTSYLECAITIVDGLRHFIPQG